MSGAADSFDGVPSVDAVPSTPAAPRAASLAPRNYQLALFKQACERNVVALLPTGSGKTLIASLLVNRFANSLVAERMAGRQARHIIFIAPTKLLVKQQMAVLGATCPLTLVELTSDSGVDFWSAEVWASKLGSHEVLVATPEVIRSALAKAYLSLARVALLVLDECHHAVKNNPMAQIMTFYHALPPDSPRPRVLGLTASPHNGKTTASKGARESCAMLEKNLDAVVVTALDWEEVSQATPRATPRVERYTPQLALETPGAGAGASGRARRLFADCCAELGLWGAAMAMRHALGRSEGVFKVQIADQLMASGSELLCAPPAGPTALRLAKEVEAAAVADDPADAHALELEIESAAGAAGAALLVPPAGSAEAADEERALQLYEQAFCGDAGRMLERIISHARRSASAGGGGGGACFLSHKVIRLFSVLETSLARSAGGAWRAVVFCERRAVAHALTRLLALLAPPGLRPGVQVGYACGDAASQRDAMAALRAFRTGELNVLFATSVLEEGVDVPECKLVAIFDLRRNTKSFIQQQGRARAADSELAILVAEGGGQEALLAEVVSVEERQLGGALKRSRALAEGDEEGGAYLEEGATLGDAGDWAARAAGPQCYAVPSTGARVGLADAPLLLHHFVAKLPHDAYCRSWRPQFTLTSHTEGGYSASVSLPGALAFGGAVSGQQPSRRAAQAAAALAAVAVLHGQGALNDHLVPSDCAAEMAAAAEAKDVEGDGSDGEELDLDLSALSLEERADGDVWAGGGECKLPDILADSNAETTAAAAGAAVQLGGDWLVYELTPTADVPAPCDGAEGIQRLGLLLRTPLPPLPPLALLSSHDGRWDERAVRSLGQLRLPLEPIDGSSGGGANLLRRFSAQVRARFFSPKHPGAGPLSPLLLPLLPSTAGSLEIDWACVSSTVAAWEAAEAPAGAASGDPGSLAGMLCATHYTGTVRLFFGRRAAPEVSCDDRAPQADGALQLSRAEYYEQRYGIGRDELEKGGWLEALPARASPRKLVPRCGAQAVAALLQEHPKQPRKLLMLPCCRVQPLLVREPLYRALIDAPAQLWRLRGLLLAHELAVKLRPPPAHPPPSLAFISAVQEAITSGAASEEVCYQRWETIGDAWLKYASGVSVFMERPAWHEGQLSRARAALVCNAALARCAAKAGLARYVRSRAFGSANLPTLSPKALADVVEALLGVCAMQHGDEGAWACAISLRVLRAHKDALWPRYKAAVAELCAARRGSAERAWGGRCDTAPLACTDDSCASLLLLERQLQYAFTGSACPALGRAGRLALLDEALSHVSMLDTSGMDSSGAAVCAQLAPPSQQRLEFLGDAVLDWVACRALALSRPDASPGVLTRLKAVSLNNERLGSRAARLRLAQHLRHGSSRLQKEVVDFIVASGAADDAMDVDAGGGCGYGNGVVAAPKVLADTAEALCGAVLLDVELDVEKLWAVAQRLLALHDPALGVGTHPVCILLEQCTSAHLPCLFEKMPPPIVEGGGGPPPQGARVRVLVGGALLAEVAGPSLRSARLAGALEALRVGGAERAKEILAAAMEAEQAE